MQVRKYIAVDLGAESGRVMVGLAGESSLELVEMHRFPTGALRVCGSLHWNIYRFFEEILEGLRLCVKEYGSDFVSIGVDAWGVDFTLLDGSGKPAFLPCHYRDERTAGTDTFIDETLGNRRLYELTGIQLLIINTLNQLVAMQRDGDDALSRGRSIMFIGDLFHYLLTGEAAVEYTIASISQLVNTATRQWEPEIFETFGIPEPVKNRIIQPGETVGPLLKEIQEATGLSPKTLVITPAVHDTASAAAAIPAEGDQWAYISTGTWIMAGFEIPEPLIHEKSYELNISNSGGVFDTSLFLKNTMGLWLIQQCRQVWRSTISPDLEYSDIVEAVGSSGSRGLYIDPDDPRFLNPDNMVEAVCSYLADSGQNVPDTEDIGSISAIVYESLACKIRYVLDILAETLGRNYRTLHAIGGGIKNRLLMQLVADICGVTVVAGPAEAAAAGNIMMQACGSGRFSGHRELRDYVRNSIKLESYHPGEKDRKDKQFRKFLAVTGLERK
jgi:rhamnulokinase